jgi:hypothetical protein
LKHGSFGAIHGLNSCKCLEYSHRWSCIRPCFNQFLWYSPLGNSMRSHVLLRLVGGKELWKSMRAASSLCLENMILIIDIFTCVLVGSEFP